MIARLRVMLAKLLLKGSGCKIVRAAEFERVQNLAASVRLYAHRSGGLNDPRRIKAQRRIYRAHGEMAVRMQQMEVT